MIKDIIIRTQKVTTQIQYSLWGWGDGTLGQTDNSILTYVPYQIDSGTTWVSGSGGASHTVAIKSDGTLWAWGGNTNGEIGNSSTTARSSPVQIGTLTNWSTISAGGGHTLSVKTDGSLWAWGLSGGGGGWGQLGDGTTTSKSSPIQIGTLTNWSKVSAGIGHSLAIKTDGTLWAWGLNGGSGQVGDGTIVNRSSPVQIGTLTNWLKISAGGSATSFAIKTDGTLWGWGFNGNGELGNEPITPTRLNLDSWSDTDAGYSYTMGIKSNGTLWGWGLGTSGQLGITIPVSPVQVGNDTSWKNIFVGNTRVFATKTDGTLWGWGSNTNGEIGDGTVINRSSPVQIGTLTDWSFIATGTTHTVALKTDNTLWSWGRNDRGQLGLNISTLINRSSPVQVGTLSDWIRVAANDHTLAIRSNGTLWGWGSGDVGKLSVTNLSYSSPIQLGTLSVWAHVGAGERHSNFIRTDGTVWGQGDAQLAYFGVQNFSPGYYSSPIQVGTITPLTKLSCQGRITHALGTDGRLWSWGDNSNYPGQAGNNTTSTANLQEIATPSKWKQVSSGFGNSIAIRFDGTLWAWGVNSSGQVGDSSGINRSSPVQIGTRNDWVDASAGASTAGAINSSGQLYLWGLNSSGQLGLNDVSILYNATGYSSPTQVGVLTTWSKISGANSFTIGRRTDGTLWSWGNNSLGQLGLGDITTRFSPVQIGTATNWTTNFSSFNSHTMAIDTSGSLYGWGLNTSGELGNEPITPTRLNLDSWSDTDAGYSYTMGIKSNGTLWGFGLNTSGQLGIRVPLIPYQIGTGSDWGSIAAGGTSNLAIKTNGTLWTWGTNTVGNLGLENNVARSSPVQVGTLTNWSTGSMSISHTMVLKTDNTLWTWGRNNTGQLGDGTIIDRPSPVQIGTTEWSKISAGGNSDTTMFSMAIKTNGTLWGWGSITGGKTGILVPNVPVQIGSDTSWSSIDIVTNAWVPTIGISQDAGSIGLKTNGTLWSWGANTFGQLGLGDTLYRSSPVQIGTGTDWYKISGGDKMAFAIKTDGSLWSWGVGSGGRLGLNDTFDRNTPVQIGTLTTWAKVAAGGNHCHAIKTDGTLWGWGYNSTGQVGDNTTVDRSSPVQIGTMTDWKEIYGGVEYSMAIKTNGTLWGWGSNSSGKLGLNDTSQRNSPVQIGTLTNWSKVSAGNSHTMAVKTDGTLWSWGIGAGGPLGLNDTISRSSPVQVGTLTNWSDVSASILGAVRHNIYGTTSWGSFNYSLALKTDGTLWSWGANTFGQLGLGDVVSRSSPVQIGTSTWNSITARGFHSFSIRTDGILWGWGYNGYGELGLNNTILNTTTTLTVPTNVGYETSWSQLSLGYDHGVATKTNGTLWTWGVNGAGQIGDNSTTTRSSPIQIGTLTGWSKVSAGASHTMAIYTDGTLWSWGLGTSGQLGLEANTPSWTIDRGTYWNEITSGDFHTMAIKTDGTLWGWGFNGSGQLGDVTIVNRSSPVQIGTRTNWSSVSSGGSHTMAIYTDGTLWGWGRNDSGQLGLNNLIDRSSPVQIGTLTNWSKVSAGGKFTFSIKTDGTLWSWGSNSSGQLGQNDITARSSPVQIGTLTDWLDVSIGYFPAGSLTTGTVIALKTNGTLWGIGGEIGDGTGSNRSSPIQIGTLTDWQKISCGSPHKLAIKTDGTLWAWGRNNEGQLGDGTSVNRLSPVQVGTLTSWYNLSTTANYTSAAIKTDGTLWSWGLGTFGQLGDGTFVSKSSPVQIGTLTNWSSISIGNSHTIAIKTDGTLRAWGGNAQGELGRGFVAGPVSRSSPIQIGEDQWTSAYAGNTFTHAIKTNGTLWSWGINTNGNLGDETFVSRSAPVQVGTRTDWVSIAEGSSHALGLDSTGKMYGWGLNSSGQLGFNDTVVYNATGFSSPTQIGSGTTWSKVSTANAFTIARRTDGTLWSWGSNSQGQLGLNDSITRWSPVQVGTGTDWSSNFSSYNTHTLAIKTDNSLWGWGQNPNGELGDNTTITRSSPVQVGTLTNWSTVSTGDNHSLSVKTDGTLWAWGNGTTGRLGDNTAVSKSSPIQIGTLTNWAKVSAGTSHSMAVKTDGTLWAWGGDGSGELGIRPIQPTLLDNGGNWSVMDSAVSNGTTSVPVLAIKTDGTLWGWGRNVVGQLGLNDTIERSSPVQIGTDTNWSSISVGASVLALKTNGTLWSWGFNGTGDLGQNNLINRSSPVQVGTLTNWSKVFVGGNGSYAIKTDGTLWAWGSGTNGALGDGTVVSKSSPVQVGTLTNWSSISAFIAVTAIKTDGTLWGWGQNSSGELGDGTVINRSSPVQIGTLTNWASVSPGDRFATAVKTDGTLWAWGTSNRRGDGSNVGRSSPVQIGLDTNWSKTESSWSHTIALKSNGTIWSWGEANSSGQFGIGVLTSENSPIQIGTLQNWSKIAVGAANGFAIDTSNNLYVWGDNSSGQLGSNNIIGGQTTSLSSPIQVGTLNTWSDVWATNARTYATKTDGTLWGWGAATNYLGDTLAWNVGFGTFPTTPTTRYSPVQIGTKTNWSEIGRGQNHITALKSDGTMWGWGLNAQGQLGLNFFSSNTNRSSPVQIGDDTFWSRISTGQNHTLSVKTDGTLWGWGLGTSGQIGNSAATSRSYPVQVGTLTNWAKVSAGLSHSMAIKTDNTLWAWGGDGSGELGIRPIQPTLIDNNTNWSSASVAASHTISIKNDGTLWAWGNNATGQLGDGTTISRSSPVQVGTLSNWSKIYASQSHCMAIKTDGTLWGWGTNPSGQLAQNDTIDRSSPVQIGTDTNWLSVSAGINFSIALKTNGTLWSWGLNNVGQLGQNNTINRSSPVQIGTDTNWSVISSIGDRTTLAIKTNGTLWGWGLNSQGNIGDNTTIDRSSPVQIGTDTNWLKVECSSNYTLALKTNGTLWAWGNNGNGQLGDNTLTSKSSPIQIGTDADWSKIFAGAGYSTATKTNGTLWGWGVNTSGQLGDGTLVSKSSPVQIGILTNWSIISNGGSHSIAINSSGNLYVWGSNSAGQLGTGTTIGGQTTSLSSPIQIGTLTSWSDIWATANRTYATRTDGTLWGWGAATNYLGDTLAWNVGFGTFPTTPTTRYSPVQIGTKTNWSEIGRGQNHIIGLKSDGSMLGWGINTNGQLGLNFFGSLTSRSSPVQIGDDTFWSEVSAGANHTLAVKNDGTLWGWGLGTGGRVGDGQVISRSYPVQIGTLTSWSKVNANIDHSVAITTSGNLWGWGTNTTGKLGDGTIVSKSSPVQIPGSNWKDVNGIGSHSIGIFTGGNLYTWGLASSGQLGYTMQRSSPVQIGDGYSWSKIDGGDLGLHTMAITTAGTLWGWGANNLGQLGDGTEVYKSSPVQIGTLTNWSTVNLSISHTMAIQTDGSLWGWGRNNSRNIDTSLADRSSPVQISTLTVSPNMGWSIVSTGGNSDTTIFTMAIRTDGTLWGWGNYASGKIGIISPRIPQQVGNTNGWQTVESTRDSGGNIDHYLGIKTDGTLWSWGDNNNGATGRGSSLPAKPGQVGSLTNWAKISAGGRFSTSIKTDGTLWAWGLNSVGQLGRNNVSGEFGTSVIYSPIQIGTLTGWSEISSGANHTIAIRTNGTLWGWGGNTLGQLGDNTVVNKSSPIQIGTLTNWSKISSYGSQTMAIKTDGTLWGWGLGTSGQLGNNNVVSISSPIQIGTLTNWLSVSNAEIYTMAIQTNGTLWGWGANASGQIGDGTVINRSSPVQIGTLTNWSRVSCGNSYTIAIKTDGTLWGWGDGGYTGDGANINRSSPVQIGTRTDWNSITTAAKIPGAIDSSGYLYTWGARNFVGVLGLSNIITAFELGTTTGVPSQVGYETSWSQLSLGADHGMATKTTGTLWGWGVNGAGQIGDGTVTTRSSPIQIGTLTGWSKVSAGVSHTMAIKTDGTLWSWGLGTSGQLGQATTIPTWFIDRNNYWSDISYNQSGLLVKTNGTLWAWGPNDYGQLGDGTVVNRSSPVQIGTLTDWSKVSTSGRHSMAIKTNGTIWSWGLNGTGALGHGNVISRSSPIQIGTLTDWMVVEAGSYGGLPQGGGFTLAIKTNGTLWGWGNNGNGQLGDGTIIPRSSPVQIGTLTNWSKVSIGVEYHCLSIKTDGTLWAWGSGGQGQLGDNTTNGKSSPVQIGTRTDWSKIKAGFRASFAITTSGTLWSWGLNQSGELGQNDLILRSSPVQIGTSSDWSEITSGGSAGTNNSSSQGIKTNGTLWGWGTQQSGELGNGTTNTTSSPVQIGTRTDWSNIYGYQNSRIGKKTDGTLRGWGSNSSGELGTGYLEGNVSRSSPIQIGDDYWSSVYAGNTFTVGIQTDGTLWGWGSNTGGRLGDTSIIGRSGPIKIGTYSKWTQVSAGASHTIAIRQE
jgi:alpha-tubulin suppressor-like RCC1 family protein